jgi:hypothetical protein
VDAITLRSVLKDEVWQHERTGAKPLVLFLATSLINQMCMPSGRRKINERASGD